MDVIAGLTPMVVVGAAFVAIVVLVKRLADRESAAERASDEAENRRSSTQVSAPRPPGTRVHMVPVDLDRDDGDDRDADGKKPPNR